MEDKFPLVSVIIVNYNGKHFLGDCFDSLGKLQYPQEKIEIVLVDNGSSDGSVDFVKNGYPQIVVVQSGVNNYCRANNAGIAASKGEYVVLLNNDTTVEREWLTALVGTMGPDTHVGAVGSKILFVDGAIQSLGHEEYHGFYWGDIAFGLADDAQYSRIKDIAGICGCSVMYRRECLREVGMLDEDFNMFLEDVDMSIRCAAKKWKLVFCPGSIVYHKLHGTIGSEEKAQYWQESNRLLLIAKHWPEKLADALHGRGYFSLPGRDISEPLGRVFAKLIKEHGFEYAGTVGGGIFDAVRKIFNFEKKQLVDGIKSKENERLLVLREKEDLISGQEKELLRREQVIVSQNKELSRKDEGILSQEKELRRREQVIISQGEELSRKDAFISEQEKELLRREQGIVSRDAALSRKDEVISGQEIEVQKRDQIIVSQGEELSNLRSALEEKRIELNGVYNSTGFRYILKPLWDLLWPIKMALKSRRALVISGGTRPRNIMRDRDIYFNHILRGTIPATPRFLTLMVIRSCNLQCKFCDVPEVSGRSHMMSTKDAFTVLEQSAGLGISDVSITGGEPFLHPDLFEIAAFARAKHMRVGVATNGVLIKSHIEKITRAGFFYISVSLDGRETTHDFLRGKSGAYTETMEGIELLVQAKEKVFINFVVTGKNVHELEDVYNYFDRRGIRVSFFPVINKPELFVLTAEQRKIFLSFVARLAGRGSISRFEYRYYKDAVNVYFARKKTRVRCFGLYREIGINTDGSISPCCVWENREPELTGLGNVFSGSLEKLWFSPDFRKARAYIYARGCSNCFNMSLVDFSRETGRSYFASAPKRNKLVKPAAALGGDSGGQVPNPRHVHMRFTNRCNLSCRHCDIWKNKNGSVAELSLHEWTAGVDKLYSWLGKFKVDLAGGEILLYKDAVPLIEYCTRKGIQVRLTTNASLITEDMARRLLDTGMYGINLSLDGLAKTHAYTRNNQEIYAAVRQAAQYLTRFRSGARPYLTVSTVITKYNLGELREIVALAKEWGMDGVSFQALDNNFSAAYMDTWFTTNEFWPRPEAAESAIQNLIFDILAGAKIFNSIEQLNDMKNYYKDPRAMMQRACRTGDVNFIVDEAGGIRLCWNMEPVGNVLRDDPREVWRGMAAGKKRREISRCARTCRMLNCNYNE